MLLGLSAIIVVVDFVPIQSHLDSSTSSATNIADDGHRPVHVTSSNATRGDGHRPGIADHGHRPALRTSDTIGRY